MHRYRRARNGVSILVAGENRPLMNITDLSMEMFLGLWRKRHRLRNRNLSSESCGVKSRKQKRKLKSRRMKKKRKRNNCQTRKWTACQQTRLNRVVWRLQVD